MFICMQKINFITCFFLEILQRSRIWRNLWCLSVGKKLASFFLFPLSYCKDIVILKLVILGSLGKPVYVNPKWCYHLVEDLPIFLQAKNETLSTMFFWRYCKNMLTSYFGYFGHAWHIRNDDINLKKNLIFLCTPKINFVIHFFFEIFFKESGR